MIVTMKFDTLDEDQAYEYETAQHAKTLRSTVRDVIDVVRKYRKYGHDEKKTGDILDEIHETIYSSLNEDGFDP